MTTRLRTAVQIAAVALVAFLAGSAAAAPPTKEECKAAFEQAQDLRSDKKLRAARERLLVCASESCSTFVRDECAKELDEVARALPTVVLLAKDAAGNDLSAVEVTMDGQLLVDHMDGTALPVDPGEHTFVFEADGLPAREKKLIVPEGAKDLRLEISWAPGPSPTKAPARADVPRPLASERMTPKTSGQRTVGLVVAGAGVVVLGAGGVLGLVARSKYRGAESDGNCKGDICNTQGKQTTDDARSLANVATIVFGVGAAAAVTGLVLWATAPSPSSAPATSVLVGPRGIAVHGSFW